MHRVVSELLQLVKTIGPNSWKRLIVGFVIFVLPIVLFIQLANEVFELETLPFDKAILLSVNSLANPTLDTIVIAITDLGYVWAVSVVTIGIVLLCIRRRAYTSALIAIVGVAGSAAINLILKALFQRDRPQLWERLVTENSYSFPSGHAMASASLAAVIIVILWPTKWRYPALIGGVAYMVVIGFTRLYLGVHYPTDIMAGWLVAGAWVAIVTVIIKKLWRPKT